MTKSIIIAAAGNGTRMKHLAKNKPKHLINILGRPFLYYLLKNISAAGFENIILVIGRHSEKFEDFARAYKSEFDLRLVNQFAVIPESKYGSAVPVLAAAADLVAGESFVYLMGDNLYGVADLRAARASKKPAIFGMKTERWDLYGSIEQTPKKTLIKIREKQAVPGVNLGNSGLYTLTPEIFPILQNLPASPKNGEYMITTAVSTLSKTFPVQVKVCRDPWLDFGKPADVPKMTKFLRAQ
jgi:dTDP-glucose pyrophosphorylase